MCEYIISNRPVVLFFFTLFRTLQTVKKRKKSVKTYDGMRIGDEHSIITWVSKEKRNHGSLSLSLNSRFESYIVTGIINYSIVLTVSPRTFTSTL